MEELIKMLKETDLNTEYVKIAKGKYDMPTSWKAWFRKIKNYK